MAIKVCRYSESGFNPHFQSFLVEDIEYLLTKASDCVPAHLKIYIEQRKLDLVENWKLQCVGFWVFIGPVQAQDSKHTDFQLNHLKEAQKAKMVWHEADLSEDTLGYAGHCVFFKKARPLKTFNVGDAVYIPKQA